MSLASSSEIEKTSFQTPSNWMNTRQQLSAIGIWKIYQINQMIIGTSLIRETPAQNSPIAFRGDFAAVAPMPQKPES